MFEPAQAVPVIDEDRLNTLGSTLRGEYQQYQTDRRMVEEQYLRSLRQVRGIYDPEVQTMIPSDRSKAYPRMTAWFVKGTLARLMQIAFPNTEKNYGVKPSPLPDLPTEQLQQVLDQFQGQNPTDEQIEKAIKDFADAKAARMEKKIDDDLAEMEYGVTLARKVIRSGIIYRAGVLEGPFHKEVKARTWQRDPFTGRLAAAEVTKYKPVFEFVPVFEYYPDLTAMSLETQDAEWRRRVLTREQVEALAARPDFLRERVMKFLVDHPQGNYKALWFESVIKGEPKSATAPVANKEGRKFEAAMRWGNISGHDLRAAGVDVKDEDLGRSFKSEVWMMDDVVIKCRLAPLGDEPRRFHVFVFEDDELNILGNSLPETLRDSQLSMCESWRAVLDNTSVIGPMAAINQDYLVPGQSLSMAKHKTWFLEGLPPGIGVSGAISKFDLESHVPELLELVRTAMSFAEKESGLPPPSVGDVSGGGSEALRTQRNASMFLGAAALPIRDTMRNFDTFTISVISALIAWNRRYDPDPGRDGDHDVIARGSTSLIAKEVLSQQLNDFRASVTPDEAPHIKTRAMLVARAKANDIPVDDLLEDEDTANQKIQSQAQAAQDQAQAAVNLIKAQVEEALAGAFEKVAKAEAETGGMQVSVAQLVLDSLSKGHATAAAQDKNLIAAHQAVTARQMANKPEPATAGG